MVRTALAVAAAFLVCAFAPGLRADEPPMPANTLFRVNAGGTAFTDAQGHAWIADKYYNTGNKFSTTASIAGTDKAKLYQTERWDANTAPDLTYAFSVTNGTYIVRLHFAEIYDGVAFVGDACSTFPSKPRS